MIAVQLNKQRIELPDDTTLAALVDSLGKPSTSLATAINGDFVPRDSRQQRLLRDGDVVMTFEPITGG